MEFGHGESPFGYGRLDATSGEWERDRKLGTHGGGCSL